MPENEEELLLVLKQDESELFWEFWFLFTELIRQQHQDSPQLKSHSTTVDFIKLAPIFYYCKEHDVEPRTALLVETLDDDCDIPTKDLLACFNTAMQKIRIDQYTETLLQESASSSIPDTKSITQFPSPEGLKFGQISWVFTSNDTVRVEAKGITKNFHYSQIGFKDNRKTDSPDMLWGLLREGFAANNGEIGFDSTGQLAKKVINQMKAHVKRLRKKLKAIFVLDEDPFEPYRRTEEDPAGEVQRITTKSYKLKMSIRYEPNG